MLTKAIIQSVDYTKNICRVRIPLFETAARNVKMIEADAQFSIVPGVYNSYKTGDIVFIGFEENKIDLPVILGKLFVSATDEATSHRVNLSGNSMVITDTAQFPHSTVFDYSKISQNKTLYNSLNTPKKLADSIIDLQRTQQTQKYQTIIEVNINGDIYKLYLKTTKDFSYSFDNLSEIDSLYRLCNTLKSSQTDGILIPLDFAVEETIIEDFENESGTEETLYTTHQAMLYVQEFNSDTLKLNVFIDGVKYDVIKDDRESRNDFIRIRSIAIQY